MLDKLRIINREILKKNINNEEVLKKYRLIQKILSDDKCFFKMPMKYAYAILKDLEIEENLRKDVYFQLIDAKNF